MSILFIFTICANPQKTGRKPEPVGKMIQAAVGGSPLGTTPGMDLKGLMDVFGTGHVNACLRVS